MIVNPHIEPHIVDEYDVLMDNGLLLPFTIDKDNGDTVDFDTSPLTIHFNLAAKRSISNPELMLPAEEITLFVKHIVSITHRTREVLPPTPDQQEQFKSLHKLNPTIQ